MSGFVYVWRDRKHRRYYVGSHWGHEDDGHVSYSSWMKKAQARRPTDFKRRVVARVTSSRAALSAEESRWLSMIKPGELGKRYYNVTARARTHWSFDPELARAVRKKMQESAKKRWRGKKKPELEHQRGYFTLKKVTPWEGSF